MYNKLIDLFEKSCHDLDSKLFQLRVQSRDHQEGTNFDVQGEAEVQRQDKIQQDLIEKRVALEQAEEDLPLHVIRNDYDLKDEVFKDEASSVLKLREDIKNLVMMMDFVTFNFCSFFLMYCTWN